ncbi:MAG: Holliday junction DNA helicase RuvA [uncultured bacterium]|nr:MAG: Holliday junction DNA helicase RuvA [uncultured bacterium]KKT02343.1 MAG: Holliday junction ATP-dependent DNA helicase RuvA, holliday junction DNA helicase RuvA [Candidatus Peregrinibacteria bacterium GW2011_GWF2_43_17]KKT20316.1 MAG: Holliday junction ATP-dependent DNA helicase RuvA [Candidatus Peregrinibacteria bacterium GW2011_GWA2_43_8]HAU39428.1 Holliday junction branch migration protein RuvA [Candidatus Peregrinibacteria bacterium]
MLAYIEGKIQHKSDKTLIINVNGVGYLVSVTEGTFLNSQENSQISLFLHTQVREDAISLYGFADINELNFFKKLISVSGIGPKTGMEIMNADIFKIKSAIINGDVATISGIKGIGNKTAERLVLELKNKIEPDFNGAQRNHGQIAREIDQDAVEALMRLGYSQGQIEKVISRAEETFTDTETCIKYFLKNV